MKDLSIDAIGLQNPGTKTFIERDLEELKDYDTNIVVNICGHSLEEYKKAVLDLNDTNANLFEINISCPNVKAGGLSFGTDPKGVYEITSELKKISKKPIVMKLTPNVTDIKVIAKAAEEGGADGISLINTLTGMKIDVEKQIFSLANKTGGLSGPAIHPVAVRMVYECASVVNIPIIGMGGVFNYSDALELMMAGASLVAVGSANFKNPCATTDIIDGIDDYMERHNVKNIKEIIGLVK